MPSTVTFVFFSHGYLETFRDYLVDRMGLAQVQIQNVALDGGTETDADDFKVLDEAFGNTDDHVVQQGTVRTVQGAKLAASPARSTES